MTIIEKLGITPGPWVVTGCYSHLLFKGDLLIADTSNNKFGETHSEENTLVMSAAPELLEALIKDAVISEDEGWCYVCNDHSHTPDCKKIVAIEKACHPKKWEEIKELL